jgi:hypothetical protein
MPPSRNTISSLTLGQLEIILESDERYYRAAQRAAGTGTRAAAQLEEQHKAVQRALERVPGMPALVRLLNLNTTPTGEQVGQSQERGIDPLAGEGQPSRVLTTTQVRQLQKRLADSSATAVRRVRCPELEGKAAEDLTLPEAAGVLDKVMGCEAMARLEFQQAMRAMLTDLKDWEERLFPDEALKNYHDWVTDNQRDLPQLGEAPGLTWTDYRTLKEWAKLYRVGRNKMSQMLQDQRPRNERKSRQKWRLAVEDLPEEVRTRLNLN